MNNENYDLCFPDQPVVDLYLPIWANLPAFASKPAFIWSENGSPNDSTNSTLTYAQLNHSVQCISSKLVIPLQRGDTVVILCSPGLELVELIFGCQRAGLLCIPIFPPDPSFSQENHNHHHLVRVLSQTNPKAAIADHNYIKRVRQYLSSSSSNNKKLVGFLQRLTWISTDDIKDENKNKNQEEYLNFSSSYNGCKHDEVYLIQYTSGATGIPKPVLVTAGSAAHNVRIARKAYDLHPNSVIVSWLPQYHDCGLMFLLLTIVSGATCVLTSPQAFVKRPILWLELVTQFKATCTPVPSFALPLVVKRGGFDHRLHNHHTKGAQLVIDLRSLINLIIINEPIYKASVDEFVKNFEAFGLNPSSISPSYGLAENCTFVSTAWRKNNNNGTFRGMPCHEKLLPVSRLASSRNIDEEEGENDITMIVVNEETHEIEMDGIEGEIWISSPSNASGYLNHPSLTREVFQCRLNNKVSQCFVRTGDRGIVKRTQDLSERFLYVTGRSLDVIKNTNNGTREYQIHPHYIETAAYNTFPHFLRGGCLAAFKIQGKKVVLVAEMQRNEGEDGRVLKRICEGIKENVLKEVKIAEMGLVSLVVVLVKSGSVPKTTSGKVQRWLAKEMLLRGKMKVVMEMHFDCDGEGIGKGGRGLGGEEGKRRGGGVVGQESEEIILCFSTASTRRPLLSFL